jgi:hypothetical protein
MSATDTVALACSIGVTFAAFIFSVWNYAIYSHVRDEERFADDLRRQLREYDDEAE